MYESVSLVCESTWYKYLAIYLEAWVWRGVESQAYSRSFPQGVQNNTLYSLVFPQITHVRKTQLLSQTVTKDQLFISCCFVSNVSIIVNLHKELVLGVRISLRQKLNDYYEGWKLRLTAFIQIWFCYNIVQGVSQNNGRILKKYPRQTVWVN